ncbi:MAG TPA: fatty acid--CoA ligase family protein [Actinomycetota bacterium]
MSRLEHVAPGPGDVLAVALPPGPEWLEVLARAWEAGAAALPVDHRMPPAEARALLERAKPTVLLDAEGPRRVEGIRTEPRVALVVHTSGTGGVPKLVEFDRRAVEAAVASSSLALEATPDDVWICCLPLAHVGGLLVLLRGLLMGAPVRVHRSFDPAAVAAERDAAFVSVVPTMVVRLLEHAVDLSHLRGILVGGSHLSPALRERAERSGARVIETYGLTESCGGVVYDGRPLSGTQVRIGDEGGIELRGPTTMLGYRFDPPGTAEAFTRDGWLRAGDAGEIDSEGRLHVVGRADDLIKTGGEKVWPDEVEAVLRDHPKVAEAAVGGRVDREWGQRVVAWVVPADAERPPSLEELRAFVAARIARHKAPRDLVVVDELPRTSSGKVRRGALVARGVPGTE